MKVDSRMAFPTTWKTVVIGDCETFSGSFARCALAGILITNAARQIFLEISPAPWRRELELLAVSPSALGFKGEATLGAMYRGAESHGLVSCPPDASLRLRVEHANQKSLERLLVATVLPADEIGHYCLFVIESVGNRPSLGAGWFDPLQVFTNTELVVFARA